LNPGNAFTSSSCDGDASGAQSFSILTAADASSIHAYPERRTGVVRLENGGGIVREVGAQCFDEPARMRRTQRDVCIDAGEQRRAFALATPQDCIQQARCARPAEHASCIHGFGDRRMFGDIGVEQLAQADDRERANLGLDPLLRTREQFLQQCVEPEIPAHAVVHERAGQASLLRRALDLEQGVERATAHDFRDVPCRACANLRR
jgi:hypothetical protein